MSAPSRRRPLACAAASGAALLLAVAAGAAAVGFGDRPDHARKDNGGFWLVLSEAYADQLSATLADDSDSIVGPRWELTILGNNRLLDWDGEISGTGCKQEDFPNFLLQIGGSRTLECPADSNLNLRLGDLNDTFAASLDLPTVFNISGEDGADYIRTGKAKDTLKGGNGNDVLRGGPAVDTLFGEADNDILDGGDGADVLDCGDGNDTVQYQGRTSALNVTLDGTANDGASGENDKVGASCENVEAWNGGDKVVGSSGANKLSGRDGNDTLKGGGGGDRLYGGDGKDSLLGEAGNDQLNGDGGDDAIDGGSGTDTIYGGSGNDTINAKDGQRDTIYCGTGDYDAVLYDVGLDEIDIGTCERR